MSQSASSGHKMDKLIEDWHEEYFVLPLLQEVARSLGLYLDSRFIERKARPGKILWEDRDGNSVNCDFVLELGGDDERLGVPTAFIECFWRRGSRHSKDKAREDSGKLTPMRDTHPTARFLGIIAAGDFTALSVDWVKSRGIDLFRVPKQKIIAAFQQCGLSADCPDNASKKNKIKIARAFAKNFSELKKKEVQKALTDLVGPAVIHSYVDRVKAALSALPQEITLALRHDSAPIVFKSVLEVSEFLDSLKESYVYRIAYTDGSEFEKIAASMEELKDTHSKIARLTDHMNALYQKKDEPPPELSDPGNNRGRAYYGLGDYQKARGLLREVLEVAHSESDPALIDKDPDDCEKARELLEQTLESAIQNLEPNHPDAAIRQSSLATVYQDLGDYETAQNLCQQAHDTLVAALGKKHPRAKKVKKHLDHIKARRAASSDPLSGSGPDA
ncbi:conserved hypothetical protein [Candidatus Desulfarcum epimagneticum]|uniref:Tetratricopeptide repeat protein n=1 Tax=uncultured Desulfobacteraceae bacterium TaxID=218296 RepID=A0A484HF49_9BACT|nr:conserved hypothetical protein [uncultured Desulfobacteraceae bacterium]